MVQSVLVRIHTKLPPYPAEAANGQLYVIHVDQPKCFYATLTSPRLWHVHTCCATHQIEFSDTKSLLLICTRLLVGKKIRVRLRPPVHPTHAAYSVRIKKMNRIPRVPDLRSVDGSTQREPDVESVIVGGKEGRFVCVCGSQGFVLEDCTRS